MLEIDFSPDFFLSIKPISRQIDGEGGPYCDWIKFHVTIKDDGFSGDVQWEAMPLEIENFKNAVSLMYQGIVQAPNKEYKAVFAGSWKEFSLTFTTHNHLGGISVSYVLRHAHGKPELTGLTGIDQSFLPEIVKSLDSILNFPATGTAKHSPLS